MKNLRLLYVVFTVYAAAAEAESLKCIQLISKVSESKEVQAKESLTTSNNFNIKIVRNSLSRIESVQLSKPKTLKAKESAIRFPEVLEQVLPNEKFSPNLKVQIDQNITLTGPGEFAGLEITRSSLVGVEKVQLSINHFVESIGDKQTFVSVVAKGVDVPASFEITIGGEIKKISGTGQHLKQKCE